jgi:DNA transposition AAA+ family ATPase
MEVKTMPNTQSGREKILKFIEESDTTITDLAVAYGLTKQDLSNYLNGKLENKKGNLVILRIISDFKIR